MKFLVLLKHILLLILLVCSAAKRCQAEELPLWELGFGIAALHIPDYRGSDEQRFYFLPIPYFVYRGERIKLDRQGIFADLFKLPRIKLNLSASVSAPVNSSNNNARSGMPDLDPTFEIGPSLDIQLLTNEQKTHLLSLRLSSHYVVATDITHLTHVGWIFSPNINFNMKNSSPRRGWNFGIRAGSFFTTEKYHDYYYEVKPELMTPWRPAFNARGGYRGSQIAMAIRKQFGKIWLGTFFLYNNFIPESCTENRHEASHPC